MIADQQFPPARAATGSTPIDKVRRQPGDQEGREVPTTRRGTEPDGRVPTYPVVASPLPTRQRRRRLARRTLSLARAPHSRPTPSPSPSSAKLSDGTCAPSSWA